MRNIKLTIKFMGTNFHGYQVQKNAVTIAEVLGKTIFQIIGENPQLKGCSRTDSGVHANMYCVSFKTESNIACHMLLRALNARLPEDISVTFCEDAPEDFHARYSSVGKRYIYKIYPSNIKDPFMKNMVHYVYKKLDLKNMQAAAGHFVGTHNFSSFCSAGAKEGINKVKTIYSCKIVQKGPVLEFEVVGNGFLYNMVRIMVGTVLEVGTGRRAPQDIPEIIKKESRSAAGVAAPAVGLYLDKVYYSMAEIENDIK